MPVNIISKIHSRNSWLFPLIVHSAVLDGSFSCTSGSVSFIVDVCSVYTTSLQSELQTIVSTAV